MIEKVKPVTKIYKKTDLNKEDRRKFIQRVFVDWKAKRTEAMLKDQVVIQKVEYDPKQVPPSVWSKNVAKLTKTFINSSSETKSGPPYMKKKNG
jgi:hypothetical protein